MHPHLSSQRAKIALEENSYTVTPQDVQCEEAPAYQ